MNYKNYLDSTLVVVCARGNSKGLKNKNIIKVNKKPLIYYAIDKILKNRLKFKCISSDSLKILNVSKKYGLKSFFVRPKNLSTSNISKLLVWQHALQQSELYFNKKFKYFLDIEVSNPLTDKKDLDLFLKRFYQIKNKYDGMFCTRESWKNPFFNILIKKKNKYVVVNKNKKTIVSRQKAPKTLDHVAAMYIFKSDYIRKSKFLLNGNLKTFNLPLLKSIDIDTKEDLELVKRIIKK